MQDILERIKQAEARVEKHTAQSSGALSAEPGRIKQVQSSGALSAEPSSAISKVDQVVAHAQQAYEQQYPEQAARTQEAKRFNSIEPQGSREQAIYDRHMKDVGDDDEGLHGRLNRLSREFDAKAEIDYRRHQYQMAAQASPEQLAAPRAILENINNRKEQLRIIRSLTPEQKREALELASGIGQALGDDRGWGADIPLLSDGQNELVSRGLTSLGRGIGKLGQGYSEMLGMGGTREEIDFIRQFEAVYAQEMAAQRPGDPWLETSVFQAIDMTPWMASIVGGSGFGKAALTKGANLLKGTQVGSKVSAGLAHRGLSGVGTAVAGGAGTATGVSAASVMGGGYAEEYDALTAMGVEDSLKKRVLAFGTASIVGLVEAAMPVPPGWKAGKVPLSQGVGKAVRTYLWETMKRMPVEGAEEYVQGVLSGAGEVAATYIFENTQDRTLADAVRKGVEQGNESWGALLVLMGAPASVRTIDVGLKAHKATQSALAISQQLQETQGLDAKTALGIATKAVDSDVDQATVIDRELAAATGKVSQKAGLQIADLKEVPGAHKWAKLVLGDRKRFKEAPDEAFRKKQWEKFKELKEAIDQHKQDMDQYWAKVKDELGLEESATMEDVAEAADQAGRDDILEADPLAYRDYVQEGQQETEEEPGSWWANSVRDESIVRSLGRMARRFGFATEAEQQQTADEQVEPATDEEITFTEPTAEQAEPDQFSDLYDSVLDSLKKTGEVPGRDLATSAPISTRLFNTDKAWNAVKGKTTPEDFVSALRLRQPGTPQEWVDLVKELSQPPQAKSMFSDEQRDAIDNYETPTDLAQQIVDEQEDWPEHAVAAATKYLDEVEEDYKKWGGRGDVEGYESEFLSALESATTSEQAAEPAVEEEIELDEELAKEKSLEDQSPVEDLETHVDPETATPEPTETKPLPKGAADLLGSVPVFKGAAFEAEDTNVVRVTRPDGLKTWVHFHANADIAEMAKQQGAKGALGAYVYKTGKKGKFQEGHIYLRSDAKHRTLTHEAIHWMEDEGILTPGEVNRFGGREKIAEKYAEWVVEEQRKPNTVFNKIYNAVESLLSSQRRFFKDVGERQKPTEQPVEKSSDTSYVPTEEEITERVKSTNKHVAPASLGERYKRQRDRAKQELIGRRRVEEALPDLLPKTAEKYENGTPAFTFRGLSHVWGVTSNGGMVDATGRTVANEGQSAIDKLFEEYADQAKTMLRSEFPKNQKDLDKAWNGLGRVPFLQIGTAKAGGNAKDLAVDQEATDKARKVLESMWDIGAKPKSKQPDAKTPPAPQQPERGGPKPEAGQADTEKKSTEWQTRFKKARDLEAQAMPLQAKHATAAEGHRLQDQANELLTAIDADIKQVLKDGLEIPPIGVGMDMLIDEIRGDIEGGADPVDAAKKREADRQAEVWWDSVLTGAGRADAIQAAGVKITNKVKWRYIDADTKQKLMHLVPPEYQAEAAEKKSPVTIEPAAEAEKTDIEEVNFIDINSNEYDDALMSIYDEMGIKAFETPENRVNLTAKPRKDELETLTIEDAKKKVEEWKSQAKKDGRDQSNSSKVVLSLFDRTGIISQPWEDAGYTVFRLDLDAEAGPAWDVDIGEITAQFLADSGLDDIDVLLAQPPCTDFAVSGARWFADKDEDGRTQASVDLMNNVMAMIEFLRPKMWALENPVGRIKSLTGLPDPKLSFHPHNFGDPYTKKTLIWGDFNAELPTANVEATEGSKMHKLRGDDPVQKAERSVTPEGFAYAFYMANRDYEQRFEDQVKQRVLETRRGLQKEPDVDEIRQAALDALRAIKGKEAPSPSKPKKAVDYASMSKKELAREATKRGIKGFIGKSKSYLVDLLEKADAGSSVEEQLPSLSDLEAEEERIYKKQPKPLPKSHMGNLEAMSKHEQARKEWRKEYKEAVTRTEAARFPVGTRVFTSRDSKTKKGIHPGTVTGYTNDGQLVVDRDRGDTVESKPSNVYYIDSADAPAKPKAKKKGLKQPEKTQAEPPRKPVFRPGDQLGLPGMEREAAEGNERQRRLNAFRKTEVHDRLVQLSGNDVAARKFADANMPIFADIRTEMEGRVANSEDLRDWTDIAEDARARLGILPEEVDKGSYDELISEYIFETLLPELTSNITEAKNATGTFKIGDAVIDNETGESGVIEKFAYDDEGSPFASLESSSGTYQDEILVEDLRAQQAPLDEAFQTDTRKEWDAEIKRRLRERMGAVDYENADIDGQEGLDAIDRAVSEGEDLNREWYDIDDFRYFEEIAVEAMPEEKPKAKIKGLKEAKDVNEFRKQLEDRGVGYYDGATYKIQADPANEGGYVVEITEDGARSTIGSPVEPYSIHGAVARAIDKAFPGGAIDVIESPGVKKPKKKKSEETFDQAADQLKAANEAMKALFGETKGKLLSGVDPTLIAETVKVARMYVKAGITTFKGYVEAVLEYFDEAFVRKNAPYMEASWWAMHAEGDVADPAGNVYDFIGESDEKDGAETTGTDSTRSDAPESMGADQTESDQEPEGEREPGELPTDEQQQDTGDGGDDAGTGTGPSADSGTDRPGVSSPAGSLSNFQIGENPEWLEGGPVTKLNRNIDAVTTMNRVEAEGRRATPDEQRLIAQYTGWGHLKQFFIRDSYLRGIKAIDKTSWDLEALSKLDAYTEEKIRDEGAKKGRTAEQIAAKIQREKANNKHRIRLATSMTPAEYSLARKSTRYSHYTDPAIARSMWGFLKNALPESGKIRVLEPSEGSGMFWGVMPDSMFERAEMHGIDMDPASSRVAKHLYPSVRHMNIPYQEAPYPEGFFDVAVTNVPFNSNPVEDPSESFKLEGQKKETPLSLHNYFFAKTAKRLREGGVVAFVTTHWTMDAETSAQRQVLSGMGLKFLGAVRLNSNAFGNIANTKVPTDVIVMQKVAPSALKGSDNGSFNRPANKVEKPRGAETAKVAVHPYFKSHPNMIAGTITANGQMRGPDPELTVESEMTPEETAEAIKTMLARIEVDKQAFIDGENRRTDMTEMLQGSSTFIPEHLQDLGLGKLAIDGINLVLRENENTMRVVKTKYSKTMQARAKKWFAVRDAFNALRQLQVDSDASDAKVEAARKKLNKVYDAFVGKFDPKKGKRGTYSGYGPLNSVYNRSQFAQDHSSASVLALENTKLVPLGSFNKAGKEETRLEVSKSDIFTTRTESPLDKRPKPKTVKDGLTHSMFVRGGVDVSWIANELGKSEAEVAKQLEEFAFRVPNDGGWEINEVYLSGYIAKKLEVAQKAAEEDPTFTRNVDALKEVLPVPKTFEQLAVKPNSPYLSPDLMRGFVANTLGLGSFEIYKNDQELGGGWRANYDPSEEDNKTSQNREEYAIRNPGANGSIRRTGFDLFRDMLAGKPTIITDRDADGRTVPNETLTNLAKTKRNSLSRAFESYIRADQERMDSVAKGFNDSLNGYVKPTMPDWVMSFDGMATNWKGLIRDNQKVAAAKIALGGNTLLAHRVGFGKTLSGVAGIMEQRRLGVARKPVTVVPNHLTAQWAKAFADFYPSAKVMAPTPKEFSKRHRQATMNRIMTGNWDAVIIPESSFKKLPMSSEYIRSFFDMQIAQAVDVIEQASADEGRDPRSIAELEDVKERLENMMARYLDEASKDPGPFFDEMGIDSLTVDEAHHYKNLPFYTQNTRVAGINPTGSKKAFDMLMKTDFINDLTGSRNVTFLTGTPIANSMTEAWVMQRYLMPEAMKEAGVFAFDDWKNTFGEVIDKTRVNTIGTGFRVETRFAQFVNLETLSQMFQQVADIQMVNPDVELPPVSGGKPQAVVVPASDAMKDFMLGLAARTENMPDDPSEDNVLNVMTVGAGAAIDFRLIDAAAMPPEIGKISIAADVAYDIYERTTPFKGFQLIWADRGVPKEPKKLTPEMKQLAEWILDQVQFRPVSMEQIKEQWKALRTTKNASVELKRFMGQILQDVNYTSVSEDEEGAYKVEPKDEEAVYISEITDADPNIKEQDAPPWNVYQEMKEQLIARGVPENEIAFIHDYKTANDKYALYEQANEGEIRVLIGNTPRLGTGANIQKRLVAALHLDAPWRPADIEQRDGRIIRPGNEVMPIAGKPGLAEQAGVELDGVMIYRFVTEGSIDARYWDTNEEKAQILQDFWSGNPGTSMDELGATTLSFSEVKAAAVANPLLKEKIELENQLLKLNEEYTGAIQSRTQTLSRLDEAKRDVPRAEEKLELARQHVAWWEEGIASLPKDQNFAVEIDGQTLHGRDEIGNAIDAKLTEIGRSLPIKEVQRGASEWAQQTLGANSQSLEVGTVFGRPIMAVVTAGYRNPETGDYVVANTFQQDKLAEELHKGTWELSYSDAMIRIKDIGGIRNMGTNPQGFRARIKNQAEPSKTWVQDHEAALESKKKHLASMEELAKTIAEPDDTKLRKVEDELERIKNELGDESDDQVKFWVASEELIRTLGAQAVDEQLGRVETFETRLGWIEHPEYGNLSVFNRAGNTRPPAPGMVWLEGENAELGYTPRGEKNLVLIGEPVRRRSATAFDDMESEMHREVFGQEVEPNVTVSEGLPILKPPTVQGHIEHPAHGTLLVFNHRNGDAKAPKGKSWVETPDGSQDFGYQKKDGKTIMGQEIKPGLGSGMTSRGDDWPDQLLEQTRTRTTEAERAGAEAAAAQRRAEEERGESNDKTAPSGDASKPMDRPDVTPIPGSAGKMLQPVQMPELFQLAKDLMSGKVPRVKRLRGGAAGRFESLENIGPLNVLIDPSTATDEQALAQTLAHEIGHLIDFLPDTTLKRGNLLGRLRSLRKFLKGTLPPLDKKDQARLRRQARREAGGKNATKADIDAAYLRIVKDQGLVANTEIRGELISLTKWWSGDYTGGTKSYVKYRESSRELYAEALSVFLNSPGDLQNRAPVFYQALLDNLDTKPDVLSAYSTLQQMLNGSGQEVAESRTQTIRDMFGKAEEHINHLRIAAEERNKSVFSGIVDFIGQYFITSAQPVFTRIGRKPVKKTGDPEAEAARYALDELFTIDSPNHTFLRNLDETVYQPLIETMQKLGLDRKAAEAEANFTLGEYLFHWRVANERDAVANPAGFSATPSKAQLEAIRTRIGDVAYGKLQEFAQNFHDLTYAVAEEAAAEGVYNQDTFDEIITPNKDNYAAFRVTHYIDSPDMIATGVIKQVGTFADVQNPFHATVLKVVRLNRLIELNRAKNRVRVILEKSFPGDITQVETVFAGKGRARIPKKRPSKGHDFVVELVNGKPTYWEVPTEIAKSFSMHDIGGLGRIASMLNSAAYKVFHPFFVTYNPGFVLANPFRDLRRTWVNLGATDQIPLRKLLYEWAKALPTAIRRQKGIEDPVIQDMLDNHVLDIPYTSIAAEEIESQVDQMFQKYGLREKPKRLLEKIPVIGKVLEFIEHAGAVTETATKVAGWRVLEGKGHSVQERSYRVRKYVGTPDYKQRGLATALTNSAMMYSRVRWNGLQADIALATNPETAAGWWWRQVVNVIMPTSLAKIGAYGGLGLMIRALFGVADDDDDSLAGKVSTWSDETGKRIAKYFLTDYDVLPLGVNREGKAVFITIPRDDLGKFIARTWWHATDLIQLAAGGELRKGEGVRDIVGQQFTDMKEELIPTFSPPIEITSKWLQYGAGINPIDSFYNEQIIPHQEWQAGGWYSDSKMIAWTLDEFGAPGAVIHYPLSPLLGESFETGTSGGAEAVMKTVGAFTGLKRFIRISNSALTSEQWAQIENADQESAAFRRSLPKSAREASTRRYFLSRKQLLGNELSKKEQDEKHGLDFFYSAAYVPLRKQIQEAEDSGNDSQLLQKTMKQAADDLKKLWSSPPDAIAKEVNRYKGRVVYDATASPPNPMKYKDQNIYRTDKAEFDKALDIAQQRLRFFGVSRREAIQTLIKYWYQEKGDPYERPDVLKQNVLLRMAEINKILDE